MGVLAMATAGLPRCQRRGRKTLTVTKCMTTGSFIWSCCGEVARGMLAVDGTVGSCDGGLDVAEGRVDPFEAWRPSRLWS
jgi:hypothetical protein